MSNDVTHPVPPVSGYRPLTDDQVALMNEGKAVFNAVGAYLDKLNKLDEHSAVWVGIEEPIIDKQCVAVARTEAQTAAMWAMRAITKPSGFA